jgi:hypothetical protein
MLSSPLRQIPRNLYRQRQYPPILRKQERSYERFNKSLGREKDSCCWGRCRGHRDLLGRQKLLPEKGITLFHSRKQLLSAFGPRLHGYVMEAFEGLGIYVVCGERPEILPGQKSLRTSTGVQTFDLIVCCSAITFCFKPTRLHY